MSNAEEFDHSDDETITIYMTGYRIKNDDDKHLTETAMKTLLRFVEWDVPHWRLSRKNYHWGKAGDFTGVFVMKDGRGKKEHQKKNDTENATFTKLVGIMNGLITGDITVRGPKKNENLLRIRNAGIRIDTHHIDDRGDYTIYLLRHDEIPF